MINCLDYNCSNAHVCCLFKFLHPEVNSILTCKLVWLSSYLLQTIEVLIFLNLPQLGNYSPGREENEELVGFVLSYHDKIASPSPMITNNIQQVNSSIRPVLRAVNGSLTKEAQPELKPCFSHFHSITHQCFI